MYSYKKPCIYIAPLWERLVLPSFGGSSITLTSYSSTIFPSTGDELVESVSMKITIDWSPIESRQTSWSIRDRELSRMPMGTSVWLASRKSCCVVKADSAIRQSWKGRDLSGGRKAIASPPYGVRHVTRPSEQRIEIFWTLLSSTVSSLIQN